MLLYFIHQMSHLLSDRSCLILLSIVDIYLSCDIMVAPCLVKNSGTGVTSSGCRYIEPMYCRDLSAVTTKYKAFFVLGYGYKAAEVWNHSFPSHWETAFLGWHVSFVIKLSLSFQFGYQVPVDHLAFLCLGGGFSYQGLFEVHAKEAFYRQWELVPTIPNLDMTIFLMYLVINKKSDKVKIIIKRKEKILIIKCSGKRQFDRHIVNMFWKNTK